MVIKEQKIGPSSVIDGQASIKVHQGIVHKSYPVGIRIPIEAISPRISYPMFPKDNKIIRILGNLS
jgi:hypothetical protein